MLKLLSNATRMCLQLPTRCSLLVRKAKRVCKNNNTLFNMSKCDLHLRAIAEPTTAQWKANNSKNNDLNNSETPNIDFWTPVAIFLLPQMAFKFRRVLPLFSNVLVSHPWYVCVCSGSYLQMSPQNQIKNYWWW